MYLDAIFAHFVYNDAGLVDFVDIKLMKFLVGKLPGFTQYPLAPSAFRCCVYRRKLHFAE